MTCMQKETIRTKIKWKYSILLNLTIISYYVEVNLEQNYEENID